MAHQPKKDPFAPIALLIGLAILGTTVFVLASNLYSTIVRNTVKGAEDNSREMAIADASLKPLGNVTAVDKSIAKVPRKGDEIFKAVCTSCHTTGVLGAPKFGSKDQWAPRIANGLPALINSATNGKGSMPPRGGDPTISDEELKAAILYMTKEAGFDLADTAADSAPAKAGEASAEKPTAPVQPAPVAQPEKPATPATPTKPSPLEAKSTKATADVAPKTEAPTQADTDIDQPAKPTTPAEPNAPAAPEKAEAKPEKAVAAPAPVATPTTPPVEEKVAAAPKADGEAVYKSTCFACHATGVAGSPLFGNKELWAPRIATGMDALYNSALKGKGAMPPKGGKFSLSDDEVKAAVDYMVSNAK